MALVLCLISTIGYSQDTICKCNSDEYIQQEIYGDIQYSNSIVSLNIENGCGVLKHIEFFAGSNFIEEYKNFSNANNDTLNRSPLCNLYFDIKMIMLDTKYRFKNSSSFDFIEGSKGFIGIFEDANYMFVSFYCKAQNGLGNYLTSKVYAKCKYVNGEKKYEVFLIE